jgi:hypothetical protein
MNQQLRRYCSLPRRQLQSELQQISGIKELHLWEFVGYGWFWEPVRASVAVAAQLGFAPGTVIGYKVLAGETSATTALADLMNAVNQDAPPYPDPFSPK